MPLNDISRSFTLLLPQEIDLPMTVCSYKGVRGSDGLKIKACDSVTYLSLDRTVI